jgi:hypothetical protein
MSDEKPGSNPFSENPYEASRAPSHEPQAGQQDVSALDAIIPTNPLAVISCYGGIFSLLFCVVGPLLGPIAVVVGIMSLRTQMSHESSYGAATSKIRAWIGIVTGVLGFMIGSVVLVLMLAGNMR